MNTRQSLAPLGLPRFRFFWLGRTVSLFGNGLAPVAVAFAVLHIGGDAWDLGLVLAARGVPQALLMLFGGVVSDRFSRDRVLVGACLASALVQAVAAGLLLSGAATITALAAIEAVHGAVSAFTMPALAGVVPLLVRQEQLQQANALVASGRTVAMMVGPASGGLIVATAGSGWALAVDAATFLVAAVCFVRLRLPSVPDADGSTWVALREGWDEFSARTWVWVVVAGSLVLNAVYAGAWMTLGPVVANDTIGADGWGWTLAALAAGMTTATVVLLGRSCARPLRVAMLGSLLMVVPIASLGFSPDLAWLMVAAFLGGVGFDAFMINWETALQQHVPADKLSRVASYDMFGSFVAIPAGQVAAGAAAEAFGLSPVAVVAAMVYALAALCVLATPAVWALRGPVRSASQTAGQPSTT